MASVQKTPARPRRFAPLRQDADTSDAPKLKGIVFDVDGTLWYVYRLIIVYYPPVCQDADIPATAFRNITCFHRCGMNHLRPKKMAG